MKSAEDGGEVSVGSAVKSAAGSSPSRSGRVLAVLATMEAQLINYLKLFGLPVGYLLNFCNTRVEWKRFVNAGG